MNSKIQVSAWGIRHNLGPISLPVRTATGEIQWIKVTEGEKNVPLTNVPNHLRATFGVTGMEIPDWFLRQADAKERRMFSEALLEEGVTLGNVTLDGSFAGDGNAVYRAQDLVDLKQSVDRVAEVGGKAARVNLLPPGIVDCGSAATFQEVVDAVRDLRDHASSRGVELLIENHCELTDTAEKIAHFRDAVGPGLGLILDTGNISPIQDEILRSFKTKTEPRDIEDTEEAFAFLEQMLPFASRVHVKTYGFHDDGRPAVYDQERAIQLITRSGFSGPIAIECASFDPPKVYPAITRTVQMLEAELA
ncbi:sugar phosphate isomerase/epimerase family protein [Novosphingobium sp. RL4]|uniref:sugar phosphate isomerase/epimerase family protein n=1 Tax=Novosphingobium sp. RL4 TaxID=3109595 RepID=UPI002D7702CE|nr:TIM barrel protein [Novosphingobium sp. RL4]WRT94442.1 TIM barrel protein [Novosphingobium sp. RL4]